MRPGETVDLDRGSQRLVTVLQYLIFFGIYLHK
jgi:hypothetical protein